ENPRGRAMREIAEGLTVEASDGGPLAKCELLKDPVYRFNDPARLFSDGTVWAWGRKGRPAAILSAAPFTNDGGDSFWLCELTSLSGKTVTAAGPGVSWKPAGPGVTPRPIPGSDAPAGDEAKRLRQMKELARRFKAHEFYQPRGSSATERYELRL